MSTSAQKPARPGFVAVFFDIPFPLPIPNGAYRAYDPEKGVACVQVSLKEGSRAFFRNRPIVGPTSFGELRAAAEGQQRPREGRSYLQTCVLKTGQQKATLNIHSGADGGFAECKYYSEVCVTFLADDLGIIGDESQALSRACEILNPFLDKYRLLNEDYRVSHVSRERNYYFATCHTSLLKKDELGLNPAQLFDLLQKPRTFFSELGRGASNILRTNSYELLGPRSPMTGNLLTYFQAFVQEEHKMLLSYDLVLDAVRHLQKSRDYRLVIVQAETACEVHVRHLLLKLMVDSGKSEADARTTLENDQDYWGVKKKIRQLDDWTNSYCTKNSLAFAPFVGSGLYGRWESDLYRKRNDAVHTGARAFSYAEASAAIGVAKECIALLESRVPSMADRVPLNPSMSGFSENAGEVVF